MTSFFGTISPSFYSAALTLHHWAVGLSITLFVARGVGVSLQQGWPMRTLWRRVSVGIDTVLLSAGVSLWMLAGFNPWVQTWLGVKLLLLPVYIVLGSYALKRGRTPAMRFGFFVAALCVVTTMLSIALHRDPWGWLAWLLAAR